MKNKVRKKVNKINSLLALLTNDRVGIYTAQASFFIMLAIFPTLLLILNIIGYTSLDKDVLIKLIDDYLPNTITPLLIQIVNELFNKASGTLISITAIVAVWSASKGVLSLMFGIYEIYNLNRGRNYFISRIISMAYTICFVIMFIITMGLLVFGNKIFDVFLNFVPTLASISQLYTLARYSASFLVLVAFFALILRIANFKLCTFKKVLPGATFSALGWIIFSYLFSLYIDNFSDMTYLYGSFTAIIILMLWLYFCIYIFFIGAEINKFLYPEMVYNELLEEDSDEDIEEIIEM